MKYSGLGVRSVGPVGDFLEQKPPKSRKCPRFFLVGWLMSEVLHLIFSTHYLTISHLKYIQEKNIYIYIHLYMALEPPVSKDLIQIGSLPQVFLGVYTPGEITN